MHYNVAVYENKKFVNLRTENANNVLKIFKTRGLSVGGCKKASGRAFFTKRLMIPEMVETYKNVSTVESPLLVNNWRPRPPFFLLPFTNFIFYILCCMGFIPLPF